MKSFTFGYILKESELMSFKFFKSCDYQARSPESQVGSVISEEEGSSIVHNAALGTCYTSHLVLPAPPPHSGPVSVL